MHSPSLDRIDSHQGYLKTNCRIVSLSFNRLKGALPDVTLYTLCMAFCMTHDRRYRRRMR